MRCFLWMMSNSRKRWNNFLNERKNGEQLDMNRILIVDDERQIIEHVSSLLKSFGYQYAFIPKPELVFKRLEYENFGLILLDINMSGKSGVELLEEIKAHPTHQDIPVIMMTGESDDATLARCFELGAADYITKPIRQLVLKARVKAVIDQQNFIAEINKQNLLLEEQKKITQKAINDLRSSINYASRIQQTVLPEKELFHQYLPEHFLFFKPRDIVSGDFYWIFKKKNKIILAACDCTGHGVPGAFMSMIGLEQLLEIVDIKATVTADGILNKLHQGIQTILKQDKTTTQDGMDVSLCVIDLEAQVLEFAGAKNPLLYVQNGEFHLIRGDRFPIGGVIGPKERTFTKHVIDLSLADERGTMFYLYSDGFQDQFGGEEGKKLKSRPFREILSTCYDQPMSDQKAHLDRFLTAWMKEEKQLDDILVIGARI